ncbi:MAG TPA: hypothetical protein VK541_14610 [Pedobacter sp.]|uniref:hypothetical protein n=1 Tax=Pedobacter sp. TaxID=1411316 RepID=UPI002C02A3A6|nr:hypothetical protein [Pedobacter sp.]HMI03712.1 hypothetical protein [Pedobacter sp.]
MKTRALLLILTGLCGHQVSGQGANISPSIQHQKSVQLSFGTQGVGAEFNYGITRSLALSAGGNIAAIKASNIFEVSGLNSTSKVSADFYKIHLMADYTPFENLRWLRLVGGAAYFFKASGDATIYPSDDYKYGDLLLSPDQVGDVTLNIDWNGFAPYLGLGFANIFPRRSFNINFDFGTYYLDRPVATIVGTGILSGNDSQTSQLQQNVRNYRWLPVLQINFNLKL